MNITKQSHKNPKTGTVYTQYIVDLGTINGKRERYSFSTKEKAQEWLRAYKRQQSKYGSLTTALSPTQFAIAAEAFQRLTQSGLSDGSLAEAVNLFISQSKTAVNQIRLGDAYRAYLESFDAVQQKEHVRTIKTTIGKVLSFFGEDCAVHTFTAESAEKFFASIADKKPKTYNNILNYTKSFFNWCVTKKYILQNPVELPVKKIAYEDPTFIKVEDLKNVLHALETDESIPLSDRHLYINFITLSFFCGARTSEVCRLTPDAIHPEDERPFVRISKTKGAARGIKGRIVDIEPNAAAWLKKYPFKGLSTPALNKLRERFHALKKPVFDALFVQNVGRHSYITYHTAKYRDCARTETYVGTSAGMRVRHYQGLTTTASGEAYFALFPE